MNNYETVYILQPDLPGARQEKISERVQKIFKAHKAKILDQKDWGKRELAYHIGKFGYGHYFYFNVSGTGEFINELERMLKLDEGVLRFLTVKERIETTPDKEKKRKKVTQINESVEDVEEKAVAQSSKFDRKA